MTCIAQLLKEAGDALIDDDEEISLAEKLEEAGNKLKEVANTISDWVPNPDLEEQLENKVSDDDSRLSVIDNYDFDDMSSDIYSLTERVDALQAEKEELEENLETLKGEHDKLFNEVQVLYKMFHEQHASLAFYVGGK